jgi:arylsulfatase A-like enzyme
MRRSEVLGLAMVISSLGACDRAPDAGSTGVRAQQALPDVVLIVLDTVRADHVSCYGYTRPTTPNLDALANTADRYAVARSTAPWTLPSHASLFTGLYPFRHRADAAVQNGQFIDALPLSQDELTLAEALQAEGFRTGAVVANVAYVNQRLGLDQGFSSFVLAGAIGEGTKVSTVALDWIGQSSARPFFLFVNYMNAHRPYDDTPIQGERAAAMPKPIGERSSDVIDRLYMQVYGSESPPDPVLLQKMVDSYDLGIANADLGLGSLIDGLKREGLYDDTLLIVTSDHGEYLGEKDLVEHSKDVYEPALRVPLVVKRPQQHSGRSIEEPISLADVPRIVLGALPSAIETKYEGKFPGTAGTHGMFAEIRYSRLKDYNAPWGARFHRERSAMYLENWKLIRSSDGKHELYDLSADPGELRDLSEEKPEETQGLLQLEQRLQDKAGGPTWQSKARDPTPDEIKALISLGYVEVGDGADSPSKENAAARGEQKQ